MVAAFAYFDVRFVLKVVRVGDGLRRPGGGATAADADATVAAVTGASEDRELARADETTGRLRKWYHFWRCVGDCRFARLTLGLEGESLEVLARVGAVGGR